MDDDSLIANFRRLCDQVRHPDLGLDVFLTESPVDIDDDEEAAWDEEVDLGSVSPEELEFARARRGALMYAASMVFDAVLDDFGSSVGAAGLTLGEDSFTEDHLPPRFRRRYDAGFYRKLAATAAKVAQDFADPHGGYPACTAEELMRKAIIDEWEVLLDVTGLGHPSAPLTEYLHEDLDFEYLYDDDMDGIEDDPLAHKLSGIEVRGFTDWFVPFRDESIVHPYAVDTASREPRLHDLTGSEKVDLHALPDAASPIRGLEPLNRLIAESRRLASENARSDTWIPDPANPEQSLAQAHQGQGLSGHLTLQAEIDGPITTTPVIRFSTHGRHPATGEAWAEVAYMGGRSEIPIAVVVSFTCDRSVRARWEGFFSSS